MPTDTTTTDDATDRFGMLELDLHVAPKAAPAAPAAAPAVTPVAAPTASTLNALSAQLNAAPTVEACEKLAREIAAGPIGKLHREDPLRVALRRVALARIALLTLALVWRRAFGSLALAIEARPHVAGQSVAAGTSRVVPVATGDALVDALTAAAAEGATNAATQASGSLAAGTMRVVGFSSAGGYVQALANGVKRATADGYLATLRGQYGYTAAQLAALTVTIIPEAPERPVGKGIRHDYRVNGKSIFDLPAAQRRMLVGDRMTAHAVPKAEDLLVTRIQGARQPRQFSWSGAGRRHTAANGHQVGACSRADLIARLKATGHEGLAPKAKSTVAHAGHAALALNVGGLVVRRERSLGTERHIAGEIVPVTPGTRARWVVGRLGREDLDLVIDLTKGGDLVTTGDETLAGKVKLDYEARVGAEVYQSGELTAWLQEVLRMWFSAAQNGVNWYVPAEHSDEARTLVRSLAGRNEGETPIWGTSWCCGQAVATEEELVLGLTAGFLDDIDTVGAEYTKAQESNVGPAAYATLLAKLNEHGARIDHYERILGAEAVAPLRARVAALRATLEPLCDNSRQRFAALELDIDGE